MNFGSNDIAPLLKLARAIAMTRAIPRLTCLPALRLP